MMQDLDHPEGGYLTGLLYIIPVITLHGYLLKKSIIWHKIYLFKNDWTEQNSLFGYQ